jgi:nucleotidyltransferase substrate binding protein (TIGR01987 family)
LAKKGLENFIATVKTLSEFIAEPIQNDRDKAGIIQAFEFTFEQCWKALRQEAGNQGVNVGSPKSAFSFAMDTGLIDTKYEKLWLEMLEDRNLTSHTYKKELADQVIGRIKTNYLGAFQNLVKKL